MKPKLLDLFCCEGGASMGYARAGFDVYGADLFIDHSRSRYPFPATRGDAKLLMLALLVGDWVTFTGAGPTQHLTLDDFVAITLSPPCQKYSITNHNGRDYPDLIGPMRELVRQSGKPYVIENVVGAPLENPIELCGCMFNLSAIDHSCYARSAAEMLRHVSAGACDPLDGVRIHLQRARLFESNMPISAPRPHDHSDHEWVGGCYGGARRDKYEAKYVRKGGYVPPNKKVVEEYMGIDWMTWKGLHQSIPPAYTEHIGRQLLAIIDTNNRRTA